MTTFTKLVRPLAALAVLGCGPTTPYVVPAEYATKMNDRDWKIAHTPTPPAKDESDAEPAAPPAPAPAAPEAPSPAAETQAPPARAVPAPEVP